MKIKIINIISKNLMVWFMLISIVSCDEKLNEPLDQEFLVEDVDYSQTEDMKGVLIGAYGSLYHLQWELVPLIGVRGDDVNAAGDQFPLKATDVYIYDPEYWIYNSVWLNLYGDIFAFNAAIDEIGKYKNFVENPAVADQYIAEVKVMKGFELLQLIRLWGNVLIPETPLATELYDLEVLTPDEGLKYISDLMDEAIPLLPDMHPNQRTDIPGGMTKYTALAVKALANLDLKNWQVVADATSDIINSNLYALESDYYHLFHKQGKLNNEIIMEYQFSDYGQTSGEAEWTNHRFYYPQTDAWKPVNTDVNGGGWGFWEPTRKYIKFMLDRGERLRLESHVLFTPDGIAEIQNDPEYSDFPEWISNVTRDGDTINNYARANFVSGKHYLPSNQITPGRRPGEGKNFICIRYSEILLSHAEAITQGATSSALSADQAVNLVRERAGLDPISGVTLDDVLDEKYAELSMEWGIRFYDLVRHNQTSVLNGVGRPYEFGEITYNPDQDKYLVYPQTQVDLLPQLSND